MNNANNEEITNSLVQDLLKEKRADRRWRNIRFLFWFALIAIIVLSVMRLVNDSTSKASMIGIEHVALIRLEGTISPGRSSSAEEFIPVLETALKDKSAKGVIIDIN